MSEETEVKKDLEWLEEEIYKMFPSHSEMYEHPDDITVLKVNLLNGVINLVDQLDEPEVLSQEWIDEHAQGDYDEWVYTEDLQNLLVPEQEEQSIKKETVEEVVADFGRSLERLRKLWRSMEVEEFEEENEPAPMYDFEMGENNG